MGGGRKPIDNIWFAPVGRAQLEELKVILNDDESDRCFSDAQLSSAHLTCRGSIYFVERWCVRVANNLLTMWTITACVVALLWRAAVLVKSVSKKGKVSLDFDDFLALVSHMQELRLTFNAIDKDANGSIDHQVNTLSLALYLSTTLCSSASSHQVHAWAVVIDHLTQPTQELEEALTELGFKFTPDQVKLFLHMVRPTSVCAVLRMHCLIH